VLDSIDATMISNEDVVRTLERVAKLLEIKGENVYKVRAYQSAATQVENLGEPLPDIAAREGGLLGLPGFGPAIAEKVGELLQTGRLSFLEQLEDEVPPTLLDLRELPGVGPRTAALLWREAGITTLDELDAAARGGKLTGIPRLGAKSVERIVATLDTRHERGVKQRRPRAELAPLVTELVETVRTVPEAARVEAAGSYRRARPDCGDLDIVVATTEPVAVLRAFAALPPVERVLLRGDTKCSVEVARGFQVDCRAVAPDQFGAAMQYFTGSQAHNVRLRGRALRMGLTLNEYGVFRIDDGTRIAGATEEEVYESLGLRWIPPEEREDRGEVDAAALVPLEVSGAASNRVAQEV
jgi:DNA polymerase (family X)